MSQGSSKRSAQRPLVLLGGILTFGNLGTILHKSSRVYLFQQAQCLNYYQTHDAAQIDADYIVKEALCKVPAIQSRLSMVDGVDSFLQCVPPLLVLATFKELLLRYGLRRLVILNLCCAALAVAHSVIAFWLHQPWTTEAALLSFFFDLFGGGDTVRITIVIKCIADISPPENLTNVYNYISGFYFLASVFGSAIGSVLLSNHVYFLNGLSIACYLFTAYIATTVPRSYGRTESMGDASQPFMSSGDEDNSIDASPTRESVVSQSSVKRPLSQLLLQSWRTSYNSILTLFSTSNPTYTVLIIYLLNGLAVRIEVLLPQYTSLALDWPLATVNRALALKALISAASLFAIPTVRKKYLEPRYVDKGGSRGIDLLITQASLLANTAGIAGLSLSTVAPLFIFAMSVYTSGTGVADSLTSYGTQTLPAGETVADLYVRTGLISTVASLIGAPLWSSLFAFVLHSDWIPMGSVFWLCAALFGVGFAGVRALKRD